SQRVHIDERRSGGRGAINCWANQPPNPPPRITTSPDPVWYRAPVKSGTEGQSGGPMAYCIMDKQDACIDPRKHDWSAAQSYWYINGQRTIVAQGEIRNIGNKPPATDWSMSISRERSRRSIPTRRAPS